MSLGIVLFYDVCEASFARFTLHNSPHLIFLLLLYSMCTEFLALALIHFFHRSFLLHDEWRKKA